MVCARCTSTHLWVLSSDPCPVRSPDPLNPCLTAPRACSPPPPPASCTSHPFVRCCRAAFLSTSSKKTHLGRHRIRRCRGRSGHRTGGSTREFLPFLFGCEPGTSSSGGTSSPGRGRRRQAAGGGGLSPRPECRALRRRRRLCRRAHGRIRRHRIRPHADGGDTRRGDGVALALVQDRRRGGPRRGARPRRRRPQQERRRGSRRRKWGSVRGPKSTSGSRSALARSQRRPGGRGRGGDAGGRGGSGGGSFFGRCFSGADGFLFHRPRLQ